MKLSTFLAALLIGTKLLAQPTDASQNLAFPKQLFTDSTKWDAGIQQLAKQAIAIYANTNKSAYFNDLFRLQFAEGNYAACLQSIDSVAAIASPDKTYRNIYGFYYRAYCMASLTAKDATPNAFASAYENAFNTLYGSLPDAGKDEIDNVFSKVDPTGEQQKFLALLKQYMASDNSISLTNAIGFVKQYNFWKVNRSTLSIAKKQIEAYAAYQKANQENKLLGLDEGAILDANAKTFITNVTVVDVEKKKLLPNVTVGITGSKITSITPKEKTPATTGATVIDGTDQFLLPGLTDAHIHFFQSGGLYTRPDGLDFRKYKPYDKEIEWTHLNMKDVLKRNIMNGITSLVDVGATFNFLELRDKFRGKSFAPTVYMTGPLLTTNEPEVFKGLGKDEPFTLVKSPEDGIKMVQQQLPYHPDLIKVWYILDEGADKEKSARKYLPIVKAIIEESHKNKLKVAIHATEKITAQLAVENGCDFLVHSVEDEIIDDAFVKMLKDKHVILCPTLTVYGNYMKTFGQMHNYSNYELKNANPTQLGSLYDLKHLPEQDLINSYKNNIRASKAITNKQDSICLVNLKKLADAGVIIAAGTDAGNPGTLHGTALLPELQQMQKSGMSNWQILQSATINPAYIFNKEQQTGSITVGKIADMVLLKANPIDSLQSLQQINLVFNKGYAIQPDSLIKETALALVQRQLNAYNARNLEAFLEPYAEDVELYEFPNKLVSKGKEAMRKDYAFFNTLPDLHCEIKERIIQGNIIFDKESVTGIGSPKPLEATAIYHIEGNKIKRVYFIQ